MVAQDHQIRGTGTDLTLEVPAVCVTITPLAEAPVEPDRYSSSTALGLISTSSSINDSRAASKWHLHRGGPLSQLGHRREPEPIAVAILELAQEKVQVVSIEGVDAIEHDVAECIFDDVCLDAQQSTGLHQLLGALQWVRGREVGRYVNEIAPNTGVGWSSGTPLRPDMSVVAPYATGVMRSRAEATYLG